MEKDVKLAVIGGSGLYEMPGLEERRELDIETPFGHPSSSITLGTLKGKKVAFLARHGKEHKLNPSQVNYPANIYALKSLGAEFVLAVSAGGSLREDYAPGDIVVPDQLVDFTSQRKKSFFDSTVVAHVGVADPFCVDFSEQVYQAVKKTGEAKVHRGGSYITVEGPRFSTKAESEIFRSWGLSMIGMTTSPEAFLAREAEIHYGVMVHVTDYDVWHEEVVSVEMVVSTMKKNLDTARNAIVGLVEDLAETSVCECEDALGKAIQTPFENIDKGSLNQLGVILEKYKRQ